MQVRRNPLPFIVSILGWGGAALATYFGFVHAGEKIAEAQPTLTEEETAKILKQKQQQAMILIVGIIITAIWMIRRRG